MTRSACSWRASGPRRTPRRREEPARRPASRRTRNPAVHATPCPSPQMQQSAALAPKLAEEDEEAEAETGPRAARNRSVADAPRAVSVGGLGRLSRETAQQAVSSGERHGRRAGGSSNRGGRASGRARGLDDPARVGEGDWWWGAAGRALVVVSPDPEASERAIRSEKARVSSFRLGFDFFCFLSFFFLFVSLDEETGRRGPMDGIR